MKSHDEEIKKIMAKCLLPEWELDFGKLTSLCEEYAKSINEKDYMSIIKDVESLRDKCRNEEQEIYKDVAKTIKPSSSKVLTTCENGVIKPKEQEQKKKLVLKPLSEFEEKEPEWFIEGYIPKYQITVIGGDGGSGKTAAWCNIVASVSSGNTSFLENEIPFEREPQKVIFFSSEDSIVYALKGRLKKSGADFDNILSVSLEDENFSDIKFNSPLLEEILDEYRPALVVFDPLQSYIPPDTQMGARNAMRACLNPLIGLGEKYKTTFLVVMHSNKQSGVWGRKRLADSADMWDIARSVLLVGETGENNERYLSQEKSNYGILSPTVIYSVKDGKAEYITISEKKDRDYVTEYDYKQKQKPARENAKEFILEYLEETRTGKSIKVCELDESAKALGISDTTLKRAKQDLKKEKAIKIWGEGFGSEKNWYISLSPNTK